MRPRRPLSVLWDKRSRESIERFGVERGTATIHGFATISKEPVPPPGDLAAFSRVVKDRGADTEAVIEHRPWPTRSADERSEGLMDYLRSGNAMTATRIRHGFLNHLQDISGPQAALSYVLDHPGVSSAVIGTTRMAHLLENLAASGRAMGDDLRLRIQAAQV